MITSLGGKTKLVYFEDLNFDSMKMAWEGETTQFKASSDGKCANVGHHGSVKYSHRLMFGHDYVHLMGWTYRKPFGRLNPGLGFWSIPVADLSIANKFKHWK